MPDVKDGWWGTEKQRQSQLGVGMHAGKASWRKNIYTEWYLQ